MGVISNIRGLIGLTGATGPTGPQGVVAFFAVTFANNLFTVAKANSAITINTSTGVVTFLVAGWYLVDWKSPATLQAANSTMTLSKAAHQIAGPM